MKIIEAAKAVLDSFYPIDHHSDVRLGSRLCSGDGIVKIDAIQALRKAVAEPYTPMTDDEMTEVIAEWYEDDSNTHALTRQIEQAVVKRIMGND